MNARHKKPKEWADTMGDLLDDFFEFWMVTEVLDDEKSKKRKKDLDLFEFSDDEDETDEDDDD